MGAGRATPAVPHKPQAFSPPLKHCFELDFEVFLASRCVIDTVYCSLYKSVPSFLLTLCKRKDDTKVTHRGTWGSFDSGSELSGSFLS